MNNPGPKLARRITLSLIVLSATLAIGAMAFHRLHAMTVDHALDLLAEGVAVQAIRSGHWLDRREAAFRLFAAEISTNRALDPAQGPALAAELTARDEAFARLAVVDDQGRVLWGDAADSRHLGLAWLKDAAGPAPYAGGVYPAGDGAPRVLFSRRLERDGKTWHLRAEADPAGLVPPREGEMRAGWLLAGRSGPVMGLGGLAPGPETALRMRRLVDQPLPAARRMDGGDWLAAATLVPGRGTALGAMLPEPVTPYKNTGLAMTIMAAVCLAYAGYVRARTLRG